MHNGIAPQWQAMRCTPFLWLLGLAGLGFAGCALDVRGNRYDEALTGPGGGNGQGGGNPGAGGSAGGLQSSSSSSSSGSLPTPESDCSDGLDNDGDGVSDCEDNDCTSEGYACVEDIPANAELVYLSGSANGCAAPWEPLSLITCGACKCSPPGVNCNLSVWTYTDSQCTSQYGSAVVNQSYCDDINDFTRYAIGLAYTPDGYACLPAAPELPSTAVPVCSAKTSSPCGNQGLCLPKADGKLCALFPDDIACPSPYTDKKAVYRNAEGTACQCSCSTSNESCTGSSLHFYNGSDSCFNGNKTNIGLDGQCHAANYATSVDFGTGTATATCGASVAPKTGDSAIRTLCCTP